jgi:hypothetical protein
LIKAELPVIFVDRCLAGTGSYEIFGMPRLIRRGFRSAE